jgi:hypothetical protein
MIFCLVLAQVLGKEYRLEEASMLVSLPAEVAKNEAKNHLPSG